jgi:hypothetical protein
VKTRILRWAAALIVPAAIGSLALAGAGASASVHPAASNGPVKPLATTACGSGCTNIFNEQWGPAYIQAVAKGKYNSPVLMRHASNGAKSQDFIVAEVGTLGDFCAIDGGSGLFPANSYSCINYPAAWPVFQAQYAPGSFTSGLCIGVAGKATNNKKVVLRDCGAAAHTFWVADLDNSVADSNSLFPFGDTPLVNASDSSITNPISLTFNGPNKQLTVSEQSANGGQVSDKYQWGATNVS